MLTREKIETYLTIQKEIGILVRLYYEEFIKCDDGYTLNKWSLTPNNDIEIQYSYYDYRDERCYDDIILSIDELNGDENL